MTFVPAVLSILAVCSLSLPTCVPPAGFMMPTPIQQSQEAVVARRIGTIKAINGSSLTLTPDSGAEVAVGVQPDTRLLQIEPGEKDLKKAIPIQLSDLQVGDRVLVGGKLAGEAGWIAASSVVVMKRSDLEARHQRELQDWQRRGLGGLVSNIDASTGTITISTTSFNGSKTIAVHTSKETVIRRYAPDSVKFDDAKVSTVSEIHRGDQLRALGNRNSDSTQLIAEEIVSGSFLNLAGVVNSVDQSAGSLIVQDLLSKQPVQVKITKDSQLRQLTPELAQRIAARLQGGLGSAPGSNSNVSSGTSPPDPRPQSPQTAEPGKMSMRSGGAPDFQQLLGRLPAISLSDLHKGDTVMIVATQGAPSGAGTAITLLSGVEPILRAAPTSAQAMMLSPWSLNAPAGDANQ
jgi:hypothetical protein